MAPVKYVYDYPEQRELAKHLTSEDRKWLANNTEFTKKTIDMMCNGKRRMSDELKKLVESIVEINRKSLKAKASLKLTFVK